MGSLASFFKSDTSSVEVGEIVSFQGNDKYVVKISEVEKFAYNTLSQNLASGMRVVINRSDAGKRFIIGNAGINNKSTTIREIFRNG